MTRAPATPEQQLAEGFARHVGAWARAAGAAPTLASQVERVARALSLALAAGHVCLHLDPDAAPDDDPDGPWPSPDALRGSGVVGSPADPGLRPLVLDDEGRLYLHRYFDYERRLARRLVAAASAPPDPLAARPDLPARLAALFGGPPDPAGEVDWQRLAAALALRRRLTVISGGPGTGKTTTVVALLACLLDAQPDARIALAAPTGKAAARMTEAIRRGAARLPAELRARLPAEASTVHRLLRVRPDGGGFVHGPDEPLACDALVVDEASMLDLALATQLFEAVPPTARIVLLGDKDQLAAVEAGAVFAELSADPTLTPDCVAALGAATGIAPEAIKPPASQAAPLADTTVWLRRTYRFASDSGIGRLARLVNAGLAPATVDWLRRGDDPAIEWHEAHGPAPAAGLSDAAQRVLDDGYAPYLDALLRDPGDAAGATAAFDGFRALCASREGVASVAAVNASMTRRLRAALQRQGLDDAPDSAPWFLGRPVLVLANDYVLRLFNGDVGLTLRDAEGRLQVVFPDAAAPGGFRAVAPPRLPRHETAFAMTVHKSQGSEFARVLVLLPPVATRVLTRELLYTAVTRARERVALVADATVLEAAITRATRRHSGLLARLAER